MKYYISGKITDNQNFKADFERAEMWLRLQGYEVINPSRHSYDCLNYKELMAVDFKLIELSDGVYMLDNWQESKGAKSELSYAKALGKKVKFENKQWALRAREVTE